MDYMEDLADDDIINEVKSKDLEKMNTALVTENTYIDDDVDLKRNRDLIVSDGSILFINGDLDLDRDSLIYGNIVVNGDVEIDKNDINIVATLYINGDLEISNNLTLGTIDRPTFIFVTGDVEIKNNISGYAYIIADDVEIGNNVNIIGGIYTHDDFEYGNNVYIQENITLDISKLYNFAVPTQVRVDSDEPDDSDSEIVFTYPKLN
jgi:UDP-3-O-[3-hydroxymyristoyl] glucosamine N-acyltransferase